jgi:hypothetical protein
MRYQRATAKENKELIMAFPTRAWVFAAMLLGWCGAAHGQSAEDCKALVVPNYATQHFHNALELPYLKVIDERHLRDLQQSSDSGLGLRSWHKIARSGNPDARIPPQILFECAQLVGHTTSEVSGDLTNLASLDALLRGPGSAGRCAMRGRSC